MVNFKRRKQNGGSEQSYFSMAARNKRAFNCPIPTLLLNFNTHIYIL